jgi:hypothetical protein
LPDASERFVSVVVSCSVQDVTYMVPNNRVKHLCATHRFPPTDARQTRSFTAGASGEVDTRVDDWLKCRDVVLNCAGAPFDGWYVFFFFFFFCVSILCCLVVVMCLRVD